MNDVAKTFLNNKDPMVDLKEMFYDRLRVLQACIQPDVYSRDVRDEQMLNEMEFVQNVLDIIERSTGEPKEKK